MVDLSKYSDEELRRIASVGTDESISSAIEGRFGNFLPIAKSLPGVSTAISAAEHLPLAGTVLGGLAGSTGFLGGPLGGFTTPVAAGFGGAIGKGAENILLALAKKQEPITPGRQLQSMAEGFEGGAMLEAGGASAANLLGRGLSFAAREAGPVTKWIYEKIPWKGKALRESKEALEYAQKQAQFGRGIAAEEAQSAVRGLPQTLGSRTANVAEQEIRTGLDGIKQSSEELLATAEAPLLAKFGNVKIDAKPLRNAAQKVLEVAGALTPKGTVLKGVIKESFTKDREIVLNTAQKVLSRLKANPTVKEAKNILTELQAAANYGGGVNRSAAEKGIGQFASVFRESFHDALPKVAGKEGAEFVKAKAQYAEMRKLLDPVVDVFNRPAADLIKIAPKIVTNKDVLRLLEKYPNLKGSVQDFVVHNISTGGVTPQMAQKTIGAYGGELPNVLSKEQMSAINKIIEDLVRTSRAAKIPLPPVQTPYPEWISNLAGALESTGGALKRFGR